MLRFTGPALRACDGFTRRDLLQAGGLSALGLMLPDVLGGADAATAPTLPSPSVGGGQGGGSAKACVVVYLFGGPSQIDTFDLKPEAPVEFRGEFRPIASNVPGIHICEHVPRLAQQADKFCLIRSMNHPHPRHGWGLYYMLTGRRHNRPDLDAPPTPDDFPGLGAVVTKLGAMPTPPPQGGKRPGHPGGVGMPHRRESPPAVTLPRWNRFLDLPNDYAGEKAGFLGSAYDPWLVKADASGQSFRLDELSLPLEIPPGRLAERHHLLAAVDRRVAQWGSTGREYDAIHARAYELLSSRTTRAAFDLTLESDRARDRYGRHPSGQGLLLARRLVEAGTPLVQVNWHNDGSNVKSPFWDTHKDNFNTLKNKLLPPLDTGLSALLEDLHGRGMLESTLILVMGEFGRTPRVGQVIMNGATDQAGRDHWPHAYTVLAAGGGIRGGQVYGASDGRAAHVVDSPVSPPDLQATVLYALGIRPNAKITDRQGRTHEASEGQPVLGLF